MCHGGAVAQAQGLELFLEREGIELVECQIVVHVTGEGIVHDPVEFVPPEIGGGILPVFPDQHDVGIDGLDLAAETLPEIVTDLVGDVEAPTVDAIFLHVMLPDVAKIALDRGIRGVPFGHVVASREFLVFALGNVLVVDDEPIEVGGIPPVPDDVLEDGIFIGNVVEHRVQDDAHPPFVGLLDEFLERDVGTESRVDLVIVLDVVFVVGDRAEDRCQVKGVHPQVFQVIELLAQAD